MKIEQRGFNITEISERVAGIDGQDGEARVVYVGSVDNEIFSPWLRLDDVKALIEALTAAHGLMTGETPAAPVPSEDPLPGTLIDGAGDVWHRVGDTSRYTAGADGLTRESIERNYGLHD